MSGVSRGARIRYLIDRLFSKGKPVILGWLVVTTVSAIVVVSLIAFFSGLAGAPLHRLIWEGLQRVLDPGGVVSSGADAEGAAFKTAMMASSVVGVVALACLIGLVTTELVQLFDNLRRGRSAVIERGHTLILGWSEHVPMIVREIAAANENHPGRAIVILAAHDPVDLRDRLADRIGNTEGTPVIFRHGDPTSFHDLETVGFSEARSIVIVPDVRSYSDSLEIKALLAIVNHPGRRPEPHHVVMPLKDPGNEAVAKMVAGDEVEVVVFKDVAARIVAQTCCQPGLSTVFTELLDFAGDEIYFQEEPGLIGRPFGESLLCYEDSAVIGLCKAGGVPELWPRLDSVIAAGDEIVAVSRDDDTVRLSSCAPVMQEDAICVDSLCAGVPQHALILGWSPSVPTILRQLDAYVPLGSTITVLVPGPEIRPLVEELTGDIERQTITIAEGVATDRETLDSLRVQDYDHVVVCGSNEADPEQSDAEAMLTLFHLRDISRVTGASFSVVTEMTDARNRELATVAEADDFVVSEHLLCLMLAQISEQKRLRPILQDIFDPEGAEIYLKPVANYVACGRPVNFYTVVEAARRRNEIAIGYRKMNGRGKETELGFGIVVNPVKSKEVVFGEADRVIVVAED